ncbi:MAG: helix-turn-helix domain-containing protein [archaeon]
MQSGKILRNKRKKMGWNLSEASFHLGLSSNIISKIERDKHPITEYISIKLKKKLNLSFKPDDILKSKETRLLEKYINDFFKKQKVTVDELEKIILVGVFTSLGDANTTLALNKIKDENKQTIFNEARAIVYELTKKLGEE